MRALTGERFDGGLSGRFGSAMSLLRGQQVAQLIYRFYDDGSPQCESSAVHMDERAWSVGGMTCASRLTVLTVSAGFKSQSPSQTLFCSLDRQTLVFGSLETLGTEARSTEHASVERQLLQR